MPQKEVGEAYSEWQRRPVRVHYVGSRPGAYEHIEDAISAAKPYDRIEIMSGRYMERIVVNKEVELVAGEGETPDISYRGTAIMFNGASCAYVVGLDITQLDNARETQSVVVADGSPVIMRCRMPSLVVAGEATPHVEGNTITGHLHGSGLRVREAAGGTYKNNRIFSHCDYCCVVDTDGSPVFEENQMWSPQRSDSPRSAAEKTRRRGSDQLVMMRGHGVLRLTQGSSEDPDKRGKVTFTQNFFCDAGDGRTGINQMPYSPSGTDSDRSTILVASGRNVLFDDNEVLGGMIGFRIAGATPTLCNNDIQRFDRYGILVDNLSGEMGMTTSRSTPSIVGNRFADCGQAAVVVLEAGGTILEDNVFQGRKEAGCGLIIARRGDPIVTKNSFSGIGKIAIKVSQGARGVIRENTIHATEGPGLVVETGATPVFEENTISTGNSQAIVVCAHAKGRYTRNIILDHRGAGCLAVTRAAPYFEQNQLTNCQQGIVTDAGATGMFLRNEISRCHTGIHCTNYSAPHLESNEIRCCEQNGIRVLNFARPRVRANNITECQCCGIFCELSADPVCTGNVIEGNADAGISVSDGAMGTFVDNMLRCNRGCNIRVMRDGDPVVRDNRVVNTVNTSIIVEDHGLGLYEKNDLSQNGSGVLVSGKSDPVIRKNNIRLNKLAGVVFADQARSHLDRNELQQNGLAPQGSLPSGDVIVHSGSCPRIGRNTMTNSPYAVIVEDRGSAPAVENNEMRGHLRGGVLVRSEATVTLYRNIFGNVSGDAVLFDDNAEGSVVDNEIRECAHGVVTAGGAKPTVTDNDIQGCTAACIAVRPMGGGTFRCNVLQRSVVGVLVQGSDGAALVTDNTIEENTYGVRSIDASGRVHTPKATEKRASVFAASRRSAATGGTRCPQTKLVENRIRKSTAANVLTEGGGDVLLERNDISHAPIGLLSRKGGRGVLTENNITDHEEANVQVLTQGDPHVMHNTLDRAKIGISVTEGGMGLFDANELKVHRTQIYVANLGDPLVKNCKMIGGQGSGLTIRQNGQGYFADNIFSENLGYGLEIESGSEPTLERNVITKNEKHGIMIHPDGMGLILRNRVSQNIGAGVHVSNNGKPTIQSNEIFQNSVGVDIESGAGGEVIQNDFYNNAACAVRVAELGHTRIDSNEIHDSRLGILLNGTKSGRLSSNTLLHCQIGIELNATASPDLVGNTFRACVTAVKAHSAAAGRAVRNTFEGNLTAVELSDRADLLVCGCTFRPGDGLLEESQGQHCTGVVVTDGGLGTFEENNFQQLRMGVRVLSEGSRPTFVDNRFSWQDLAGALVEESGAPTFTRNVFSLNKQCGLLVRSGGAPIVEENDFHEQPRDGVLVERGGLGVFTRNQFESNKRGATITGDDTSPEFAENEFRTNEYGLVADDDTLGNIHDNLFCENTSAGVQTLNGGNPRLTHNAFATQRGESAAFEASEGGCGVLEGCLIAHCATGVRILSKGAPEVVSNLIMGCETGVLSTQGGAGTVTTCCFRSNRTDVRCEDGGNTTFHMNVLGSVTASERGEGQFTGNLCIGRVLVSSGADPRFAGNLLKGLGALSEQKGKGRFEKNHFYGLADALQAAMEVTSGGEPAVDSNTFLQCVKSILTHDGGLGTFSDNTVCGSKVGVEVGKNSDPSFSGNSVESCDRCIHCVGPGSKGTFENVSVSGAQTTCVVVDAEAAPLFKTCDIYDGKNGVVVNAFGGGEFQACNIFDCSRTAVIVDENGAAALVQNKISSPFVTGALEKRPGAQGAMEGNKVRHQFSPQVGKRPPVQDREQELRRAPQRMRKQIAELEARERELHGLAEKAAQRASDLFARWNIGETSDIVPKIPRRRRRSRGQSKTHRSSHSPGQRHSVAGDQLDETRRSGLGLTQQHGDQSSDGGSRHSMSASCTVTVSPGSPGSVRRSTQGFRSGLAGSLMPESLAAAMISPGTEEGCSTSFRRAAREGRPPDVSPQQRKPQFARDAVSAGVAAMRKASRAQPSRGSVSAVATAVVAKAKRKKSTVAATAGRSSVSRGARRRRTEGGPSQRSPSARGSEGVLTGSDAADGQSRQMSIFAEGSAGDFEGLQDITRQDGEQDGAEPGQRGPDTPGSERLSPKKMKGSFANHLGSPTSAGSSPRSRSMRCSRSAGGKSPRRKRSHRPSRAKGSGARLQQRAQAALSSNNPAAVIAAVAAELLDSGSDESDVPSPEAGESREQRSQRPIHSPVPEPLAPATVTAAAVALPAEGSESATAARASRATPTGSAADDGAGAAAGGQGQEEPEDGGSETAEDSVAAESLGHRIAPPVPLQRVTPPPAPGHTEPAHPQPAPPEPGPSEAQSPPPPEARPVRPAAPVVHVRSVPAPVGPHAARSPQPPPQPRPTPKFVPTPLPPPGSECIYLPTAPSPGARSGRDPAAMLVLDALRASQGPSRRPRPGARSPAGERRRAGLRLSPGGEDTTPPSPFLGPDSSAVQKMAPIPIDMMYAVPTTILEGATERIEAAQQAAAEAAAARRAAARAAVEAAERALGDGAETVSDASAPAVSHASPPAPAPAASAPAFVLELTDTAAAAAAALQPVLRASTAPAPSTASQPPGRRLSSAPHAHRPGDQETPPAAQEPAALLPAMFRPVRVPWPHRPPAGGDSAAQRAAEAAARHPVLRGSQRSPRSSGGVSPQQPRPPPAASAQPQPPAAGAALPVCCGGAITCSLRTSPLISPTGMSSAAAVRRRKRARQVLRQAALSSLIVRDTGAAWVWQVRAPGGAELLPCHPAVQRFRSSPQRVRRRGSPAAPDALGVVFTGDSPPPAAVSAEDAPGSPQASPRSRQSFPQPPPGHPSSQRRWGSAAGSIAAHRGRRLHGPAAVRRAESASAPRRAAPRNTEERMQKLLLRAPQLSQAAARAGVEAAA
eukprot:TRINITY_DN1035_c2_g1_i2.p1 TRINITY_DN1035_c2_g1~~TRINITY_DN1035_c2_g1_i2.p1  ORF type:complete len:2896 (+),score=629.27 TRINITY_DN1035_c2_g1_i2:97-8784(+)